MPKIKIEGQTINGASVGITDEIANDDDLLKAALAPTWPDVRTATFKREGGKDGKELVVVVQKKAGTKGVSNPELDEQARFHHNAQREAERVRKLEDVALAADRFLSCHSEFANDPPSWSEYIDDLGDAVDALGDEIATIRTARRFA